MTALTSSQVSYPPLNVLKPVAENIWIVDGGPISMMGLSLPIRMTVIRLSSGEMWLHSPTEYDQTLHQEIEKLGEIRHLVAPNIAHWSFLKDWQAHCPAAVTWAAPELRRRAPVKKSGVRLDRDLGEAAPDAWADDIEQTVLTGGAGFREVAFLHKPSCTVVLTDLVVNLEAAKLPLVSRTFAKLTGTLAPDGKAPAYLRLVIRMRQRDAVAAASRILAWAPERVIFTHGRWFERDGTAALRRSLAWLVGSAQA